MSPPRPLEDISKRIRADAHAETIDLCNGRDADRPARRADTDAVTIAPPRLIETLTQIGPRDQLPARPPLVTTAILSEPGAPAASAAAVPGGRLGQYELIRLIGRGGMGTVYLARDLRLGRLVAIKLLARGSSHDNARFVAEARVTARCNHENIVVIHDVGEHDQHPYMVFEYVAGQTLRAWLDGRAGRSGEGAPPLEPRLGATLMIPVVRALAYAHDLGIVHRDLKPANIMLTDAGAIKVLDFGIAKLLAGGNTSGAGLHIPSIAEPGAIMGTLPYMSPEQLEGDAIDHRTDLWAVGIMLYEMVTGTHPVIHDGVHLHHAVLDLTSLDLPMPSVGERRDDLGPLAGIIDRCLIKDRAHRTRDAHVLLQELEALSAGGRVAVLGDDGNPFAGLAPFQEADADRFYGRSREVGAILARLRSCPLIALAGPSGVGKSSLVRAGVIPVLKRSGEGWDALTLRPGRSPLASLSAILVELASSATDPVASASGPGSGEPGSSAAAPDDAGADLRGAPGQLGAALRAWAHRTRRRVLLFVDQFEELYTLCADPDERAAFMACLEGVADDASSPLRVVVSIRSDFLDRLTEHRQLAGEISRGLMLVPPLDRDGLRDALVRPVEAADCRYEDPAIIDDMLAAVAAAPGSLPLLQFAAARLWTERDRDRRLLTRASYEAMGGIAGTLAGHADHVLDAIPARERVLVRAIFERLVTPERTRAVVSLDELRELPGDPDDLERLVHRLVDARLLVIEARAGDDRVAELVHESLIERWPTLVRWLDENKDDAAMLARLRGAARDWERSGHAAGLLWTGAVASEAHAWRQRYQGELAPVEQRYFAAMRAAADRARRVRRRSFGGILATVVLIALVMAWLAWKQTAARKEAAAEATRARDATRMAAMRALPEDPTTQLALLREIEDLHAPPPGAAQEAKHLLYAGVAPVVLTDPELVWSAAFSPDGRRIVSASGDKTVRVWSADGSGEPLVLRGHTLGVKWVSFSSDGRRIVSASGDDTVRVWNADGTGTPVVLHGHEAMVMSAAFSPDGQRIVSASVDKTVRIWSADGGDARLVLRGHASVVRTAAFSPDGQHIVSASLDKTVRVWRTDERSEPLVLRDHADTVNSAAFSPDGRRIVSASHDRTVRVWNADGHGEPLILRGHQEAVISAAFSPDGRRIVSASHDRTVRVWNADASGEPLVLRGHDDLVVGAAFSPDGRRIVSVSWDKTVRVWDSDGRGESLVLRGHDDSINSAVFSPDGRHIVSASSDHTIRVWNSDGRGEPLILHGHDNGVVSAIFSTDGRRIVSASMDNTVRVWNSDGHGEPLILRHHAEVDWAEFSSDGQRILSVSADHMLRVWQADGRGEPVILIGHENFPRRAGFSPDGRSIVSAAADRTVRVWHDLAPATIEDPRLWKATSYCMPIERRIELLGVSAAQAERDRQRCLERVERARARE